MNAPSIPFVADETSPGRDSLAGRLALLGKQMLTLAGEVSPPGPEEGGHEAAPRDQAADCASLGLLANEVYRDRRRRARHLPSRMLGEPAWDIMLALFIADARGEEVTVSNACLAADVPASTALRWLHNLAAEGLVERLPDAGDARRHYVRLSGSGMDRMIAYFSECGAGLMGQRALGPALVGQQQAFAAS